MTKPHAPKNVSTLLQGRRLQAIMNKTQQLQRIEQLLANLVEPNLLPHIRVMNITMDTLSLEVDAAAFAVELRYNEPDLLQALHFHTPYREVNKITYHVRPRYDALKAPQKANHLFISHRSRKLLAQTAANTTCPKLAQALRQLAAVQADTTSTQ